MEKEIKDMSEVEIKAMCYDQLAQIEQCQGNLKVLNQELVNRVKQKSTGGTIDGSSFGDETAKPEMSVANKK